MPPITAAFAVCGLLAFLGALALLICDAAAGLAGRLARGLALAAAAVLCALAKVTGLDGLDMFHNFTFHTKIIELSLAQYQNVVNQFFHTFLIFGLFRCSGICAGTTRAIFHQKYLPTID